MRTPLMNLLHDLRYERGELLKHMAAKLGISSSKLSAYENGKEVLPSSIFNKIVDVYHLPELAVNFMARAVAETVKIVQENQSKVHSESKIEFAIDGLESCDIYASGERVDQQPFVSLFKVYDGSIVNKKCIEINNNVYLVNDVEIKESGAIVLKCSTHYDPVFVSEERVNEKHFR